MSVRILPSILSGLFIVALFVVALPEDHQVHAAEGLDRHVPLARLGNDHLDPHAAWVVESYTASEPVVPSQVLGTATPGFVSSPGDVADPLRRLTDETTL